ncbi:MAG: PAS domain-containing protein, partial [Anaerolineae bacterium]|nr:PAS domain-containing protein [Anaerolineae bacterium]
MHILMIDDNEDDFACINRLIINSPDTTINWCETVQTGLMYLASHPVDALLLGINLEDIDELAVLDATNDQFPALPIIILSNHESEEIALEALQHGAQDTLVKGKIEAQLLEKTLRYAVERKQVEGRLRKQFEETLTTRVQEEQAFQRDLKALHEVMVGLTNLDDLDEIYRQAVKRGLEDLGFDRFGLLLYNPDGSAQGTYGTDAHGNLWPEHYLHFSASQLPGILQRAIQREDRFALDEDTRLSSDNLTIGMGWNAVAVLWDGSEQLGWLATDNAIRHLPLKQRYMDILALYALTLGTLLGQKRTEEHLRQERDLLRTLIDSLPDYILVKDREGCVVISNTSHAQTTDLMPDELITKAAFDALPVDVSNRLRTEDQEIMQSGKAIINLEREVIGKDKKPETILITKIPLRDATGTITGLIAVGRDITERKQLEAQSIELANKRERIVILQRFIDDMSHDFRTPLSIIRNSLYLLQRIDDAEKQQIYTQRAEQQISRLDTLLDELLQMKNLDAQEVQFDLKLTDINSLLAQLVHDYQQVALPKQITLDFISADEVCLAEIDHQEFIRAVAKLLDNAIAYTPEQGSV